MKRRSIAIVGLSETDHQTFEIFDKVNSFNGGKYSSSSLKRDGVRKENKFQKSGNLKTGSYWEAVDLYIGITSCDYKITQL